MLEVLDLLICICKGICEAHQLSFHIFTNTFIQDVMQRCHFFQFRCNPFYQFSLKISTVLGSLEHLKYFKL